MLRKIININHTLDCDEDLSQSDVAALVAQHLAEGEVDTPEFIILNHIVTNRNNMTVHNIIVDFECK